MIARMEPGRLFFTVIPVVAVSEEYDPGNGAKNIQNAHAKRWHAREKEEKEQNINLKILNKEVNAEQYKCYREILGKDGVLVFFV